jgi:hypothetical protein
MGTNWFVRCAAIALLVLLGRYCADAAPPQVIATNPPNGAVGVRPGVDTIQILLDKPIAMQNISPAEGCVMVSDNWPTTVVPVIGFDGLLYHFERNTRGTDLPLSSRVELTINPPGSGQNCVKDQEGNLLPTYNLSFTIRQNQGDLPVEPQVVSTYPPRGATGVSPDISSISITFSKPMAETADTRLGAWFLGYGWSTGDRSWSPDGRTLTITRSDAGTPLPMGQTVIVILNWGLSMRFQATDGNVLPEYALYFTVEGDKETFYEGLFNVTITRIPANPSKGFHWPYYLSVPNSLRAPAALFVEPNNSGSPAMDLIFHDVKAAELLYSRTAIVNVNWDFQVPILVPVFPRTYGDYIQALHLQLPNNCNCPELERPDLQLIAMIDDARERLRSAGHTIDGKVFMNGFSASCGFTGGFTILHPEFIKAAACGGGLPDEYDPQRISALETVTGQQIDLPTYFKVPLYLYVGDQDGNYNANLWLSTRQFYESAGASAQLVLYPGVGHTITEQMWSDLRSFFEHHNAFNDTIIDTVQKVYIGYYQRPADPGGLVYWKERLDRTNGNLNEIIEAYANSAESQALYGTINSSNISNVVDSIYMALFNRHAEPGGLTYYVSGFNSGRFTAATIMLNVLYGAQNDDLQSINNKLAAANLFTRTIDPELDGHNFQVTYAGNADAISARTFLTSVTGNPVTIPTRAQMTTFMKNNIADTGDPILTP